MNRQTRGWRMVAITICAALLTLPANAQTDEPNSPRAAAPLTVLQLNDVYSTVPIDGLGGLARVATMKTRLAATGRTPFLILAGDFLSPSMASSIFKGEQMIAALNAAGLDLATLGNHEFDFGPDVLLQRMAEAKWQWVVSNVVDTRTNRPVGGAVPYIVKTFGALKVGFIGLCLNGDEISMSNRGYLKILDPIESAGQYLPMLEREGADVIVAVTHLAFADDRRLAERYPDIDLVVGGHEHYPISAFVNRTFINKAGADAKWLGRIDVSRSAEGTTERFVELLPVNTAIPDEPRVAAVVAAYESKLSTELDVVVGTTTVGLDASSLRLRTSETNLGNLAADAIRSDVGADLAILNSGGIRGERLYAAGPIARRTINSIHPFGSVVCKLAMKGRDILAALENGVSQLPRPNGRFPQVSGLTMKVTPALPAGQRIADVRIAGVPIEPTKMYTVATSDYQVEGGDGYSIFTTQQTLVNHETGPLLTSSLEKYIAARGTIAPAVEGRITIVESR